MKSDKSIGLDHQTAQTTTNSRRNRVLVIGIDQYLYWTKLQYPVSDCTRLLRLLEEHYGFAEQDYLIQPLYNENATADTIYDELYRLLEKDEFGNLRVGPNDNLILVFSGHGHLDKSLDEGYWAPVDAPVPGRPSDLKKLVSVSEVIKILSQAKAHHIVLLVDACFSGAFARMAVELPSGGDANNPEEKPSRWVLTAGRLEPVPDKSPFAEALLQVLSENDKPSISIDLIGAKVVDLVRTQTGHSPLCDTLVELKFRGGEFFFHRRTAAARSDQTKIPAGSINDLRERLRAGSKAHFERLKKGRFKMLRIEKRLLPDTTLPGFWDTQVRSGEQETSLYRAVKSLWNKEKPHAVVLGEGGMGKTVSLVRLWEELLDQSRADSRQWTVPVFITLNEFNAVPEAEQNNFILHSIARQYLGIEALTDDWKNAIWDLLQKPLPDGTPAVLLLLDGFNEVTVQKDQLLLGLNRLSEQTAGVQMVITSRFVEIQNFTWARHTELVELLPLPQEAIAAYLQQMGLPLPDNNALLQLFANPMMLTLYTGSSSIGQQYRDDQRFRFLPVATYGELLWNFNEAQLAKYLEDHVHDADEQLYHIFLLRCLTPYLAFRMEKEGQFFITTRKALNPAFNFKILLNEAFTALNTEELAEVFPVFEGKRALLDLGEPTDMDAREKRSARARQYLVEKLQILVQEGDELRFLHQNFRDFFAAYHLLNEIRLAPVGSIPTAWKERPIAVYLRQMLGDIEGEHRYNPQEILKGNPVPLEIQQNLLACLLALCRGRFDEGADGVGFAVWNVLSIWKDVRKTLAGADLSLLNLQIFHFNNMLLNTHLFARYLPANFTGSLLRGVQFIFEGHLAQITHASYSPDGKKILSASSDRTVKEWSVETGVCLQTLQGHLDSVTTACYSPDGKKILSASMDNTVKEWLVETGICLQTLKGHSSYIKNICYSSDGKKILSASGDKTMKEWLVETGDCLQTYRGHSLPVYGACYSPDGKKILSSSPDGVLKVWLIETGVCIKTWRGHFSYISNIHYSIDGTRMLSASSDSTLKEWSLETRTCLRTLKGHSDNVSSVCYSPDGKKILSASWDRTLKEWSLETGSCLQTLQGHSDIVFSACYSFDGKKILSASADKTLKEWSVETGSCLQTLQGHSNSVSSVSYSLDGKKILASNWDGRVKEWSIESEICLQTLQVNSDAIYDACYSPDAKKILCTSADGAIKEWLVKTGTCLQTLQENDGPIISICYSPDGKKILSAHEDGTLKEWLVDTGKCIQYIQGHPFSNVCYSPPCLVDPVGGKKILSASENGSLEEWSVETGRSFHTIEGHSDAIYDACYSPDAKKILSASSKGMIKEWLVETGNCLQTLKGHTHAIYSICYSSDGQKILSASWDKLVKEWLVETGACLQTLQGHSNAVMSVSYSPDGCKILSASWDGLIIEWSVETGACLRTLVNEVGLLVQSVDFRHLHPSSIFTEDEKERLRRYGAIFNDEDEKCWKEAVEDAYGDDDELG